MKRNSEKMAPLRHVAIIMDGNGRWAKKRGLPRLAGHQEGVRSVERVIKAAADVKIPFLSFFAFSTENWKRPRTEVDALMSLFSLHLRGKVEELKKNGVRLLFSGRRENLPAELVDEMKKAEERTSANMAITVAICINYGGRQEIVDSVNRFLLESKPAKLTEDIITSGMYNPDIPDPDLVIRTSGETRLSNFLLWQAAYSELYFTETLWPDFCSGDLHAALEYFYGRDRRYGGLNDA